MVSDEFRPLMPSGQVYITSINNVEYYADSIMRDLSMSHFTDHSILHSKRILNILLRLIALNDRLSLNDAEKYILITGALLHDIGMQFESEVSDIEERRKCHHELSLKLIEEKWKEIGIIEGYGNVISKVVWGHRGNYDGSLDNIAIGFGTEVRTDLLVYLLYLADELDLCSDRVDINKVSLQSLDETAAYHFYRHYYIQGILVDETHCIKIIFRFPPHRKAQYSFLFKEPVVINLKKVLDNIRPILTEKYGIILTLRDQDVNIIDDNTIESISAILYEKIYSFRHGLPGFIFIKNLPFNHMVGNINPELFYNGNVRWEDIVNNLDIYRSQYASIADALHSSLDASGKGRSISCLLICGEGGSGKTTILMRLAYFASQNKSYEDINLLWLRNDGDFSIDRLRQLYFATQNPIIAFVDGMRIWELTDALLSQSVEFEKDPFPLVIVIAARYNEWKSSNGEKIKFSKFTQIKLDVLDENEMVELLGNLKNYNQLHKLESMTFQERIEKFKSSQGQLLVAMLEATRGMGFYDIIMSEYTNIKNNSPEAAKAYEFTSLLYYYDVLVPIEILLPLAQCTDFDDFEERVVQYTHLVIVRHPVPPNYGLLYRPRHIEIARALMDRMPDYDNHIKRLKKFAIILRGAIPFDKRQRYVIVNYLNNYINLIIKILPKVEYPERIDEMRTFLKLHDIFIQRICDEAEKSRSIGELIQWSKLFYKLGMNNKRIEILKRILTIKPLDVLSNYYLASALSRDRDVNKNTDLIVQCFQNSYKGGNFRASFLIEFISFVIKNGRFDALDEIAPSIKGFIANSDEEHDAIQKISNLLNGYQIRKDSNALVDGFQEIMAHINATRQLRPEDELSYIDTVETENIKKYVDRCEEYLFTINPNRPRGLLLRIAHLAFQIGQGEKAIEYYEEIFEKYIKKRPVADDYPIILEYAQAASMVASITKEAVYNLFRICMRLRQYELGAYEKFAIYAKANRDNNIAIEVANRGLEISIIMDKYNTKSARNLKDIIKDLHA